MLTAIRRQIALSIIRKALKYYASRLKFNACCDNCKNLCKDSICDVNETQIDNVSKEVCDDYVEDIY